MRRIIREGSGRTEGLVHLNRVAGGGRTGGPSGGEYIAFSLPE